jgi:hypothetical protein
MLRVMCEMRMTILHYFVGVDALLNEPEGDDDSDFYLPPH